MRSIAKLTSYIFHPILMPLIGFMLMYFFAPYIFSLWSVKHSGIIFIQLFINTIIFPVVSTLLMVRLGFVSSMQMSKREDRILPLIASMIFFIWTFVGIRAMQPPLLLLQMMFGATISLVIAFVVNIKFKISLHSIGAGNLIVIIIFILFQSHFQSLWLLILGLLIAGLIGSSRLVLNAHSKNEVLAGYFVGIVSQLIAFFMLYKII